MIEANKLKLNIPQFDILVQTIKDNFADTPNRKKALINLENARKWLEVSDYTGDFTIEGDDTHIELTLDPVVIEECDTDVLEMVVPIDDTIEIENNCDDQQFVQEEDQ